MSTTSGKKQGSSSTALKALRVLEIVADSREALTPAQVAERLGSDKVSAYRMLVTLEEAGYLIRDDTSKRYALSYKVVSLSRNLLAENEVSKLIQQTLRDLSNRTQETLHYSVLDGFEAVLVHRVKGTQLVNVDFQIGDRSMLHCTSIGKAVLAYQSREFVAQFLDSELTRRTQHTIVDPERMAEELSRIREQGYAIDEREFAPDMRCIAVPVIESGGRVASGISISGPDSRFTRKYLKELSEPMVAASRELSRRLGGLPWQ